MELQRLENRYWIAESRLREIASAQRVSVRELTQDIDQFDDQVREQVGKILWEQVDLLEKILHLKRILLRSEPVVNLASYRAVVS